MKKSIILVLLVLALIFTSLWVVFNNSSISSELSVDKEQEDPIIDDEKVMVDQYEPKTDEEVVIEQEIEIIDETDTEEPKTDEEILIRYDSKNNIDMGVVYSSLIEDDKENIIFKVRLNNHSINLEDIKYDELAKLSFSNGTIIDDGFIWESNSEGHHISGKLKLPKNYLGTNINLSQLGSAQLEFEDIGGPDKMTFRWEKEVIDLYTN